jgi:hypothetical protein
MHEFEDTHAWVRGELMDQLEDLFVPCFAQDVQWWARARDAWDFEGDDGALLGDSNLNRRHLLCFYFLDNGNRVSRESWEAGRQSVTAVSIRYRGPVRVRLRHGGQLVEHRLQPTQESPDFGVGN